MGTGAGAGDVVIVKRRSPVDGYEEMTYLDENGKEAAWFAPERDN